MLEQDFIEVLIGIEVELIIIESQDHYGWILIFIMVTIIIILIITLIILITIDLGIIGIGI